MRKTYVYHEHDSPAWNGPAEGAPCVEGGAARRREGSARAAARDLERERCASGEVARGAGVEGLGGARAAGEAGIQAAQQGGGGIGAGGEGSATPVEKWQGF